MKKHKKITDQDLLKAMTKAMEKCDMNIEAHYFIGLKQFAKDQIKKKQLPPLFTSKYDGKVKMLWNIKMNFFVELTTKPY